MPDKRLITNEQIAQLEARGYRLSKLSVSIPPSITSSTLPILRQQSDNSASFGPKWKMYAPDGTVICYAWLAVEALVKALDHATENPPALP